jgi:flagellar motor protein MotB
VTNNEKLRTTFEGFLQCVALLSLHKYPEEEDATAAVALLLAKIMDAGDDSEASKENPEKEHVNSKNVGKKFEKQMDVEEVGVEKGIAVNEDEEREEELANERAYLRAKTRLLAKRREQSEVEQRKKEGEVAEGEEEAASEEQELRKAQLQKEWKRRGKFTCTQQRTHTQLHANICMHAETQI